MARARNIKPGFYKNEDLAECSVWARLLFPGLWMLADREGRLENRPKRIKGEIFPYDCVEVDPLLFELEQWGFIDRYVADGKKVISIVHFLDHQFPHGKEADSEFPNRNGVYAVHERDKRSGCVIKSETSTVLAQDKSETSTVLAHPESGLLNPESGLLNPDVDTATVSAIAGSVGTLLADHGIVGDLARDFVQHRKAKKAPITKTALDAFQREADKAGVSIVDAVRVSVERGWVGFKAEWEKPNPSRVAPSGVSDAEWSNANFLAPTEQELASGMHLSVIGARK